MLSPIKNYSCQKLLKYFNSCGKDVLKHATKILCLLSKLHLLASCRGEQALPSACSVPWKGWSKETHKTSKRKQEKSCEKYEQDFYLKWGKMPQELLLKILLHNVQSPILTAIIQIQNSLLLFVRHILSNWQGVKFKSSALNMFFYGFILC